MLSSGASTQKYPHSIIQQTPPMISGAQQQPVHITMNININSKQNNIINANG